MAARVYVERFHDKEIFEFGAVEYVILAQQKVAKEFSGLKCLHEPLMEAQNYKKM